MKVLDLLLAVMQHYPPTLYAANKKITLLKISHQ